MSQYVFLFCKCATKGLHTFHRLLIYIILIQALTTIRFVLSSKHKTIKKFVTMNPISLLINYFKNDINSTYLECKSLHYKCICFNYTSNKYIILPITFNNAIFSIKNSLAMHTIIFKLSIKLLPILKNPYSMSLFHIIFHISFEHFPISVLYLFFKAVKTAIGSFDFF